VFGIEKEKLVSRSRGSIEALARVTVESKVNMARLAVHWGQPRHLGPEHVGAAKIKN
jgi:hypothetical protein